MKVYLHKKIGGNWTSVFDSGDMSSMDYVLIGTAEVEFTMLPQAEVVNKQIDVLNLAKEALRAETQQKINQIDGQIQSLLAITHEQ